MVSSNHYVELWIEGQLMELESQDSLNLRINNVLFDPTKLSTTQAEYSFSFELPSTPNNDKILSFANNLSKLSKFHTRYDAVVVADGTVIFEGSLTITKYNSKDKMYECNLVNIKIDTLEEIFGDDVLTDVDWSVPFEGAETINDINFHADTDYYFPLVSYGVFPKKYITRDEVGAEYSSKFVIDKYNKWWVESFPPSLRMVEEMRKCFEYKGYKLSGNIFSDPFIKGIYCSTNLANDQFPLYNLGNPKFGEVRIQFSWNNYDGVLNEGRVSRDAGIGMQQQDLTFPYFKVQDKWNFPTINWWNMLDSTNNPNGVSLSIIGPTYLYDPTEMCIVIPADGWYRIHFAVDGSLSGAGTTFQADQWCCEADGSRDGADNPEEKTLTLTRNFDETCPLEVQLIRNYDENIELIKGRKNVRYQLGDPTFETYSYAGVVRNNKEVWYTEFPHQNAYANDLPTEDNGLLVQAAAATRRGRTVYIMDVNDTNTENGGARESSFEYTGRSGSGGFASRDNPEGVTRRTSDRNIANNSVWNSFGYQHKAGRLMPYDQAVSSSFICGFSSMGEGQMAVMRDGKSWSRACTSTNDVFAPVEGMELLTRVSRTSTATTQTNYCKNEYKDAEAQFVRGNDSFGGAIDCCVYLNKNDILELAAIQRDYNGQAYYTSVSGELIITAMSQRSKAQLKADSEWGYYSETEFPVELNLMNFTNKEMKISDWIKNIMTSFNLEMTQDGDIVEINTNQGINKNIQYAVDIDDRVSEDEAESEYISYPKEMAVKWKIDTDEWGFERTVPDEHINDEDWKKWGDSGFTIVKLNDDTYETASQNVSTQFSYTYYDTWDYNYVSRNWTQNEQVPIKISIPVIEKAQYMADGYGYDEAMKHDGFSQPQRFWYRDQVSQESVYLADHQREEVYLDYPIPTWEGFHLSYKDNEKSIVTEYFNCYPMLSSNYVNVEPYLNPMEYNALKNGALVKYDSDLYYLSEIQGFDPSGTNTTKLKLIKKV